MMRRPATSFFSRLTGAALLDAATYEEVEADETATPQAIAVVVLSSLASGVGALGLTRASLTALIFYSLLALAAWGIWAFLTFQIGSKILHSSSTRASVGELLRTIGFATAPGLLRVIALIPGASAAVFAVTAAWMLMAVIVAVRQALDYTSTARAVAVCLIGFALAMTIAFVIGLWLGPTLSGRS